MYLLSSDISEKKITVTSVLFNTSVLYEAYDTFDFSKLFGHDQGELVSPLLKFDITADGEGLNLPLNFDLPHREVSVIQMWLLYLGNMWKVGWAVDL